MSLKTLVKDIYAVLSKPRLKEEEVDALGQSITSILKKRLMHGEEERGNVLRMSNLGQPCKRKLWYTVNMPDKAEQIEPWVKLKFLYGDIIEALVLALAKAAGHKVEGEQDELEVNGIKGHRDAIIDGTIVDVKSANSRGFDKFKYHKVLEDDAFGYSTQANLYAFASKADNRVSNRDTHAFIAVDKEMGHIVVDEYKNDNKDWEKFVQERKDVVAQANPPPRSFFPEADGKSGNMQLPLPCRYCAFKKECHKDANMGKGLRTFLYSSGPRYLTKVVRLPEVTELK